TLSPCGRGCDRGASAGEGSVSVDGDPSSVADLVRATFSHKGRRKSCGPSLLQRPLPVVMGPGFRRDDSMYVARTADHFAACAPWGAVIRFISRLKYLPGRNRCSRSMNLASPPIRTRGALFSMPLMMVCAATAAVVFAKSLSKRSIDSTRRALSL